MKKIILSSIVLICLGHDVLAQTGKKKTKKPIKISKTVKTKTAAIVKPIADSTKMVLIDTATTILKNSTIGTVLAPATKSDTTPVVSSVTTTSSSSSNATTSGNSNSDIISGLKEALTIGTDNSSKKLNKLDGFFGDAAIKILMPEEAKKVESTLRSFGMGSVVDKAILSMNRAAEDAAGGIGTIFFDAIKQMNISDGLQILRGGDFAATDYLKRTTTTVLTAKFKPVIEASLTKMDATKYWQDVFSAYNQFSSKKVNTDLTTYVTERALNGLFLNIGLEEQKIRKDPVAQVTGLLKNVFGKK